MDMLISPIVVIILQCTHIWKHHVIHPKLVQFLFAIYTSIRLRGKRNECVFSLLNWDTDVMVGAGASTLGQTQEVKDDGVNSGTLILRLFCEQQEIHFCHSLKSKMLWHISKQFLSPEAEGDLPLIFNLENLVTLLESNPHKCGNPLWLTAPPPRTPGVVNSQACLLEPLEVCQLQYMLSYPGTGICGGSCSERFCFGKLQ